MRIIDITGRFSGQTQLNFANDTPFAPHLRVQTEREVPNPIFLAGMLGARALRCVPVPNAVWTANEITRDALVKNAIQAHFARCKGSVPAYGRVKGYDLVVRPGKNSDFGIPDDTHGDRSGPIRTVPRLGEASLSVDGQKLSQSIWGRHGPDRRD